MSNRNAIYIIEYWCRSVSIDSCVQVQVLSLYVYASYFHEYKTLKMPIQHRHGAILSVLPRLDLSLALWDSNWQPKTDPYVVRIKVKSIAQMESKHSYVGHILLNLRFPSMTQWDSNSQPKTDPDVIRTMFKEKKEEFWLSPMTKRPRPTCTPTGKTPKTTGGYGGHIVLNPEYPLCHNGIRTRNLRLTLMALVQWSNQLHMCSSSQNPSYVGHILLNTGSPRESTPPQKKNIYIYVGCPKSS